MKKSYLVTPLIAGALILPTALPATAAQADVPASAAVSTVNKTKLTADQVKAERAALNSRINMLRETQKAIPGSEYACLLYTSPSPRDKRQSRMPSSA